MAKREQVVEKHDDGIQSRLVAVNRITKVVKGGRNMRFTAFHRAHLWIPHVPVEKIRACC